MIERQLRLVDDEILLPPIQVKLDPVDRAILDIFLEHPTWHLKAHQVKTILEYQNIHVSHARIAKKLEFLVITTILMRHKGSRVYTYFLHESANFN